MPKCWGCDGNYASSGALTVHLRGDLNSKHASCAKFKKLYNPVTLVSEEWRLLDDDSIKPVSVDKWKEMFGTGTYSVYVYLTKRGKIFTRVGQTGQEVKTRISLSTEKPADDEEVYELATGLSRSGAVSLEAYLLQCHELRHENSTIRNYQYGQPLDAPEDKSSAEMRALAVRLHKGLMLRIKRCEVKPVELRINRIKQRSRATPSDPVPAAPVPSASTEKMLEMLPGKSNSQLEVLRQSIDREQKRRTSTAESRKRARPNKRGGGGTPTGPTKSRR